MQNADKVIFGMSYHNQYKTFTPENQTGYFTNAGQFKPGFMAKLDDISFIVKADSLVAGVMMPYSKYGAVTIGTNGAFYCKVVDGVTIQPNEVVYVDASTGAITNVATGPTDAKVGTAIKMFDNGYDFDDLNGEPQRGVLVNISLA